MVLESKGIILASELQTSIERHRLSDEISQLRKIVFDKLQLEARREGANAVVGIRLETNTTVTSEFEVIGSNQRRAHEFMVEVAAMGTAVIIGEKRKGEQITN